MSLDYLIPYQTEMCGHLTDYQEEARKAWRLEQRDKRSPEQLIPRFDEDGNLARCEYDLLETFVVIVGEFEGMIAHYDGAARQPISGATKQPTAAARATAIGVPACRTPAARLRSRCFRPCTLCSSV